MTSNDSLSMSFLYFHDQNKIIKVDNLSDYQIGVTLNDSMSILKCYVLLFSMHLGTNAISKLSLYYERTTIIDMLE